MRMLYQLLALAVGLQRRDSEADCRSDASRAKLSQATHTALKSALKSVCIKTVQAFLLSSSKSLVMSAKVLAPMSAMLPYHQEVERERGSPRQRKRPRKLVRRELFTTSWSTLHIKLFSCLIYSTLSLPTTTSN